MLDITKILKISGLVLGIAGTIVLSIADSKIMEKKIAEMIAKN